jgi:hypothetical protein
VIRICHLINDLDAGGTERALVNVVKHLDPSRFSNEVVSLIEPGVFGHDLRAAGIPLTSLGMRRGRPSLWGLAKVVRHLRVFDTVVGAKCGSRMVDIILISTVYLSTKILQNLGFVSAKSAVDR